MTEKPQRSVASSADGTQRRSLLKAAAGGAVAAFALARPKPAFAADSEFVLAKATQGDGTFRPVFTRHQEADVRRHVGFYTGMGVFNGRIDPFVSMGHYANGDPEWTSALNIEADWDTGPTGPRITEIYWQIMKPDGVSSRRPLYGKYDRDLGRAVSWQFLVGNGMDDTGNRPGAFAVRWDNDSGPVGTHMFSVEPNSLNLFPVKSGGIAPSQTRLRMYSAAGNGSAIALTFNAGDASGTAEPTLVLQSESSDFTGLVSRGVRIGGFEKPSARKAGLALRSGLRLGDNEGYRSTLWSVDGSPPSALGSDGDFAFRRDSPGAKNQRLYVKAAGAWDGIL